MATPPSQKYRQISFSLTGGNQPDALFTFVIRPEELTRSEPSRLTQQQTLGGAWVDAFGAGISTISLSGHNGWRGGLISSGEDLFAALRTTVFQGWHDRRTGLIKAGQDPSLVELIFTDNLDAIRVVVAPQSFSLRRSRSRPLLMMYQIQLVVLGSADTPLGLVDSIINALSDPLRWITGQLGLTNVVSALATVQNYVTEASNVIGAVKTGITQVFTLATTLFNTVASIATSNRGVFTGNDGLILSSARQVAVAANNALEALAADPSLTMSDCINLATAAAAMNDAACTMANAFDVNGSFLLIDPLFGASTCSSTAGGDPASVFVVNNASPFESLNPIATSPITVTEAARAALATLSGDPLLLVGQNALIGQSLVTIGSGIAVSGT
jgi:hypothetical protein